MLFGSMHRIISELATNNVRFIVGDNKPQVIPYQPPTQYQFLDEKRKLGMVKRIRKQMDKFELTNVDLGFATT